MTGRVLALAAALLLFASAGGAATADPPLPPARPKPSVEVPPAPPTDRATPVETTPAEAAPPAAAAPAPPRVTAGDACRARLTHLGATFETRPRVEEGTCGIEDPVEFSGVAGRVVLDPPARLDCEAAEMVARWMTEAVPAALGAGDGPVTVAVAESYGCRTRNRVAGAPMSEHGLGHALDVSVVRRGAMAVPIKPSPGEDAAVTAARDRLRRAACDYFTTVLGPGSDEAHGDHLHVDVKQRNGGYRICE